MKNPEAVADAIFNQVSTYVARRLEPLQERIEALEAQTKDLKYCGVWRTGKTYCPGNFATHAGSLWHCDEETTEPPGKCNAWTLAAKGAK